MVAVFRELLGFGPSTVRKATRLRQNRFDSWRWTIITRIGNGLAALARHVHAGANGKVVCPMRDAGTNVEVDVRYGCPAFREPDGQAH